jgi:hypothetical protein
MTRINDLIKTNPIRIVSGEGTTGSVEEYAGHRTLRAIRRRLEQERCGGDRWARAEVYSHRGWDADVYVDVETGEYC